MKVTCLFVAIFGLALIVGCSETPSEPSVTQKIVPLEIGNQWAFEYINNPDSSSPYIIFDTVRILYTDTVGNRILYYDNHENPRYYENDILYTTVDSLPWFIVKPPKFLNEVVRNDTLVIAEKDSYGDPTGQFYTIYIRQWVSTLDTTITVKAGTFPCFGYTMQSSTPKFGFTSSGKIFYSPGIGYIKSESYQDTISSRDNLDGIGQLISYHLN